MISFIPRVMHQNANLSCLLCDRCNIEINPPLDKNTGNISREDCKSGIQTSAHARVCLQDLQDSREIFLVILAKGR